MTTLQIIFSHESGQDVANIPIGLINMSNEHSATMFLKVLFNGKYSFLPDGWKENVYNDMVKDSSCHIPEDLNKVPILVKISMCVTIGKGEKWRSPKWYKECNGKIYFSENIEMLNN